MGFGKSGKKKRNKKSNDGNSPATTQSSLAGPRAQETHAESKKHQDKRGKSHKSSQRPKQVVEDTEENLLVNARQAMHDLKFDQAEALIERARDMEPESPYVLESMMQSAHMRHDTNVQYECSRELLSSQHKVRVETIILARYMLGAALRFKAKNVMQWEECEKVLTKYMEMASDQQARWTDANQSCPVMLFPQAWQYRAMARFRIDKHLEAWEDYKIAMNKFPKNIDLLKEYITFLAYAEQISDHRILMFTKLKEVAADTSLLSVANLDQWGIFKFLAQLPKLHPCLDDVLTWLYEQTDLRSEANIRQPWLLTTVKVHMLRREYSDALILMEETLQCDTNSIDAWRTLAKLCYYGRLLDEATMALEYADELYAQKYGEGKKPVAHDILHVKIGEADEELRKAKVTAEIEALRLAKIQAAKDNAEAKKRAEEAEAQRLEEEKIQRKLRKEEDARKKIEEDKRAAASKRAEEEAAQAHILKEVERAKREQIRLQREEALAAEKEAKQAAKRAKQAAKRELQNEPKRIQSLYERAMKLQQELEDVAQKLAADREAPPLVAEDAWVVYANDLISPQTQKFLVELGQAIKTPTGILHPPALADKEFIQDEWFEKGVNVTNTVPYRQEIESHRCHNPKCSEALDKLGNRANFAVPYIRCIASLWALLFDVPVLGGCTSHHPSLRFCSYSCMARHHASDVEIKQKEPTKEGTPAAGPLGPLVKSCFTEFVEMFEETKDVKKALKNYQKHFLNQALLTDKSKECPFDLLADFDEKSEPLDVKELLRKRMEGLYIYSEQVEYDFGLWTHFKRNFMNLDLCHDVYKVIWDIGQKYLYESTNTKSHCEQIHSRFMEHYHAAIGALAKRVTNFLAKAETYLVNEFDAAESRAYRRLCTDRKQFAPLYKLLKRNIDNNIVRGDGKADGEFKGLKEDLRQKAEKFHTESLRVHAESIKTAQMFMTPMKKANNQQFTDMFQEHLDKVMKQVYELDLKQCSQRMWFEDIDHRAKNCKEVKIEMKAMFKQLNIVVSKRIEELVNWRFDLPVDRRDDKMHDMDDYPEKPIPLWLPHPFPIWSLVEYKTESRAHIPRRRIGVVTELTHGITTKLKDHGFDLKRPSQNSKVLVDMTVRLNDDNDPETIIFDASDHWLALTGPDPYMCTGLRFALQTMRLGERADITVSFEYAASDLINVPPGTSVIFDVTLWAIVEPTTATIMSDSDTSKKKQQPTSSPVKPSSPVLPPPSDSPPLVSDDEEDPPVPDAISLPVSAAAMLLDECSRMKDEGKQYFDKKEYKMAAHQYALVSEKLYTALNKAKSKTMVMTKSEMNELVFMLGNVQNNQALMMYKLHKNEDAMKVCAKTMDMLKGHEHPKLWKTAYFFMRSLNERVAGMSPEMLFAHAQIRTWTKQVNTANSVLLANQHLMRPQDLMSANKELRMIEERDKELREWDQRERQRMRQQMASMKNDARADIEMQLSLVEDEFKKVMARQNRGELPSNVADAQKRELEMKYNELRKLLENDNDDGL